MRNLLSFVVFAAAAAQAQTQLTVYNDKFAAVKETRKLTLARGENESRLTDITAHHEPESVIVRALRQAESVRILEQNGMSLFAPLLLSPARFRSWERLSL